MRQALVMSGIVLLALLGVTLLATSVLDQKRLFAQSARVATVPSHVPTEGFGAITIDVATLHDCATLKPLRDALSQGEQTVLKRIEAEYGVKLEDIDRLTAYYPSGKTTLTENVMLFIATRKPLDKSKILTAWNAIASTDAARLGTPGTIGGPGFGGVVMGNVVWAGGGQRIQIQVANDSAPATPAKKVEKTEKTTLDLDAPYYLAKFGVPQPNVMPSISTLIPLDDRHIVVTLGSQVDYTSLVATLLRKRTTGPLAQALSLGDKHTVVASFGGKAFRDGLLATRKARETMPPVMADEENGGGPVQPPVEKKEPLEPVTDEFTPYEPLFTVEQCVATLDLGETTTAKVTLRFPNAEAATKALPTAKGTFQDLSEFFTGLSKTSGNDSHDLHLRPFYALALSVAKNAKFTQDSNTISITISQALDATFKDSLVTLPRTLLELGDRMKTFNNLVSLGTAFTTHMNNTNAMPNDIQDEKGNSILSWRVHLLPFLGEEAAALYAKIDRNKPWDDPINKKHWDSMPDVFRLVGRPAKEKHETYMQSFYSVNWVGESDTWQVDSKVVTPADVTDGVSASLMMFEAEGATNWMKPSDVLFEAKKLPLIGDPKTGKAYVITLDSGVRRLDRKKLTGDRFKSLITINGGEPVDLDDAP